MRYIYIYAALLSFSLCFGQTPALDELMPKAVQKQTGVADLSEQQKKALAEWLNANIRQSTYHPNDHSAKQLHLSENIKGGKYIRLSNNSLWEIDPQDLGRSSTWLFPIPIQIQQNHRSDYPYTMTNMRSGSKIDAKRVDKKD